MYLPWLKIDPQGMRNPYENSDLRAALDNELRPGGLKLTQTALNLCELKPGAKILDIGCGAGASLGLFRALGHSAVGLDISAMLVAESARQGPVLHADATLLPIRYESLDAAFLECVLSLLPNKAAALKEVFRALKPFGMLAVSDIHAKGNGEPRNSPGSLCEAIAGAGFTIIHAQDHSRCLGELAARLIWQFGTNKSLCELLAGTAEKNGASCPTLQKYGYALYIAKKTAHLDTIAVFH